MERRRCKTCECVQPIGNFEPAARYRGGRMPVCRSCRATYRQELHERAKADPGSAKRCVTCTEVLPIASFGVDRRSPDGRTPRCKTCRRASRAGRENPVKQRERMLRWKYGITVEDYEAALRAQGGLCASCSRPMDPPHIDHDHATGAFRALLCSPCNTAPGLLREDVDAITALRDYLERHTSRS